jgi:hypothetical protein
MVPAGISQMAYPTACLYCLIRRIRLPARSGRIPTEPGCSIISLEVSLSFGSLTLSSLSLTALPL